MPTAYDVAPQELVAKTAEVLKKEIQAPVWTKFVKTSSGKARPPDQDDWYYQRAASILKKVYRFGPIGTNKLRVYYGTKQNRGHQPEIFRRGSGKIVRSILQQLEKQGYLKQEVKGTHKGRVLTPKGKQLLDTIAKGKNDQQTKSGGSSKPAAPSPQTN